MATDCPSSLWDGHTVWLQPNFCASLYAGGTSSSPSNNIQLYKPRGLHIEPSTDEILLVDRGHPSGPRVIRLDEHANANGNKVKAVTVAKMGGLNHGIELSNGYLYASTETTVYRWPYQTGQTTAGDPASAQRVIVGMDRDTNGELGAQGGHTTRTLAFDAEGRWLYVSIGSYGNVDADSFRSRIRRFDISEWDEGVSNGGDRRPLAFIDGEVFADGLRNEVGLAFDSHGDLWGVENGADRLYRDDIGGDIHNDNPSEELNRFPLSQAGGHWGYPYCWSEYCLVDANGGSGVKGANTQWAWPSFISSGYTDAWCRRNTIPSVMSMPAHSAPLGITFYNWQEMTRAEYGSSGCRGGFPKSMDKYAFIAYHGSWNRNPPTGYKVVFIPFDNEGNPSADQPIDLFRHGGIGAKWPDPVIRPVDVQFDRCGRLYVTEDGTGSVIRITYEGNYFGFFETDQVHVEDGSSCSSEMAVTFTPKPTRKPTKKPTRKPSPKPTRKPSSKPVPGAPASGEGGSACLTRKQCNERRKELGYLKYRVGPYPTKGCFAKNNIAYFGRGGTVESMSTPLSGRKERIWCKDESAKIGLSTRISPQQKQPAALSNNGVSISFCNFCIIAQIIAFFLAR